MASVKVGLGRSDKLVIRDAMISGDVEVGGRLLGMLLDADSWVCCDLRLLCWSDGRDLVDTASRVAIGDPVWTVCGKFMTDPRPLAKSTTTTTTHTPKVAD